MSRVSLDGPARFLQIKGKIDRAQQHYDAWNATLDRWLDGKPYGIKGRPEEGTDWFVVKYVETSDAPYVQLSLIFSDYVHNLRAALDHAVWHLLDLANKPTGDATGFPVVRESKDWGSALGSRLKGFPSNFVGIVHDAQPFQDAPFPERHWLYLLHHLDIRNKHRLLIRLGISSFEWEPTFECNRNFKEGDRRDEVLPPTPYEMTNGAELVRIRMVSEQDDLRIVKLAQVPIPTRIGIGPFDDLFVPLAGTDLPDWTAEVRAVIDALAPAFGS